MPERDLVFFSYRHDGDGARWLSALQGMLEPYVLGRNLIVWSDRDIRTGEQWHDRIQSAIDRTRVAVLLVNQHFFGSEYIRRFELPRLVADAREGKLTPVVALIGFDDPALRTEHGLASFQFGHDPRTPLNALRGARREKTLVELAMKIRESYGIADPPSESPSANTFTRQGTPVANDGKAPDRLGPLLDVPPLNLARFVPRPEELAAIRDHLLNGTDLTHGLTASARGLGLHGMGGMGKSVMAQALCHDEAVRCAFPDGVAWVALGQQPDLLSIQNRLLRLLQPDAPAPDAQADGSKRLRELLQDRCVLVVVDDIWDARHFPPLDVTQGRSRTLLTTRDSAVLAQLGARAHSLGRMSTSLALELLALRSGCARDALPPEAHDVVMETGGVPLAVALAGAQVADGVSWSTLREELRAGRIEFLDHAYGSVYASLGRSVDGLPPPERERYLELAVFPEDTAVPASVIARLWSHTAGMREAESEKLLARFDRKALLTVAQAGSRRTVSLHDLQHDFLRLRADDLADLHGRLLDAYRASLSLPSGPSGWAGLPYDEPYLWRHLATHLLAAGRQQELDAAFTDRSWIAARLASETRLIEGRPFADVATLRGDFMLASANSPARKVMRALGASAHFLGRYPAALDQMLFGRLGAFDDPRLHGLARSCLASIERREWLVPTVPALAPPGPLGSTLTGHAGSVNGALLLPDGRRALSWSWDNTLRLWDLEQGNEPRVLTGHQGLIYGALLLPDGRRALSWSKDNTLRLWDLEQGGEARVLTGHADWVNGALLLPDGRRALSWSGDNTLRLWDLEQGGEPRVLTGHAGSVNGALLMPDGRRALSWSEDNTLRLWDLEQGGEPRVLTAHEGSIYRALLLPDGRRALSCSSDNTLRLWDLEQGGEPRVLTGHKDSIYGALLLPDGQRALSWSRDNTLRLWDLEQGGERRVLTGHEGSIYGALLLPDGRRALSWSSDSTLRLWDLEQGGELRVLTGHKDSIYGALLLPDGRRALSWSGDNTLRLWDLEQGGEPRVLTGHEGSIYGALLLPDGRRALSWSRDNTLQLWDLERGDTAIGCYFADGYISAVVVAPGGGRAFLGDALGYVQILQIKQQNPTHH